MRQNIANFSCRLEFFCLLLVIPALILSACTPRGGTSPEHTVPNAPPAEQHVQAQAILERAILPATFSGTIPCDGCDGIKVHLNLQPDGTFQIKRTYLYTDRKSNPVLDSGTWSISPDNTIITLQLRNRVLNRLKMTDADCMAPVSPVSSITETSDMRLCRTPEFEPLEEAAEMRGLYSYMADLGMFRDCRTSERYPVAMEKDNAALERAYLNSEHGIAEPLVVRFMGHITTRPAMEGSRMDKVVVVDRFIEITGARSCKGPAQSANGSSKDPELTTGDTGRIENRKWELIEIAGTPVNMPEGLPAPGFRLNPDGKSLRGFGGCNRMMGSYMHEGSKLMFSGIATTRRFCEETQGLEDRFVQALGQVRRFTIEGNILTLYGDYGELAKLKSEDRP